MYQNTPESKEEAETLGSVHYISTKPCKRGHVGLRYTKGSTCVECHRQRRRENWKTYTPQQKRHWGRKQKYGISEEEYYRMWETQENKCLICHKHMVEEKSEDPMRVACVDHCHKTGNVRGLLCFSCNSGLGKFEENVDFLRSAISYLEDQPVIPNYVEEW